MYYCAHRYAYYLLFARVALSGAMLFIGGASWAQTVRMFEDPPSVEQLRSIMVPESKAGASRTIVIQRPGSTVLHSSVKPASTGFTEPGPPPPPAAPIAIGRAEAKAVQAAGEAGTVAFRINFAFNSAVLPESARVMVDRVAQLMKEEPQVKLRIEGHTDAAGSVDYNISLSEQRAMSVGQYLVTLGVVVRSRQKHPCGRVNRPTIT